jgi:tetratricopeptide (TPR) repeat protein
MTGDSKVGNGFRGWALGVLSAAALLQGCANLNTKTPAEDKAAMAQAFSQGMADGNAATTAGDLAKAHAAFDKAAKADPASKAPWLRKAQVALDANDYGLAIQSAQEANQRDAADVTAKSITAVAGLRASSQALRSLRQDNAVSGSTRGEAETLARTIREALGEDVLVPPVAGAASAPKSSTAGARPAARPRSPAAAGTPPAPARPASAAAGRGSDPFGTLKLGN